MVSHPDQPHENHKTSHTIVALAGDCLIAVSSYIDIRSRNCTNTSSYRSFSTCLYCWWLLHDHVCHCSLLSLNEHTRRSSVLFACTGDQQLGACHLCMWRHCFSCFHSCGFIDVLRCSHMWLPACACLLHPLLFWCFQDHG